MNGEKIAKAISRRVDSPVDYQSEKGAQAPNPSFSATKKDTRRCLFLCCKRLDLNAMVRLCRRSKAEMSPSFFDALSCKIKILTKKMQCVIIKIIMRKHEVFAGIFTPYFNIIAIFGKKSKGDSLKIFRIKILQF